jgi:hypothetical protein
MDDPGPGPETETLPETSVVGAAGSTETRRLYTLIGVLVAVIVVLLVRPWGDGSPRPPSSAAPVPAATRSTSASPPPLVFDGPLDVICGSPSGWRAATLQDWPGRQTPIRSWIAITPVPATGPTDVSIPFAPIATGRVTAIGYCAPMDAADQPPPATTVSLWVLDRGAGVPLALVPLEPPTPDVLGGLWLPPADLVAPAPSAGPPQSGEPSPPAPPSAAPDGSAGPAPAPGSDRSWPPGRYLVRLSTPDGSYDRWLGIEIEDLTLLQPAPTPTSGASASPAPSPSPGPSAP